jgi:hypothetical protein
MAATIPRAEVAALTAHHSDPWQPDRDVTPTEVRADAVNRRYLADHHTDTPADRQRLLAEASDLDALADRYETGATR